MVTNTVLVLMIPLFKF